ncbi:MAG: helix-turn-helix domain-containing protein [Kiloniellales bacterium]|nr:helix-turn-helix domain-containing protein [Kiloniellales bacterium]
MYSWSNRLNDVMKQRGWSQSELARRAQVSRENVKKYCQGLVSQPRGETLPRLAEALGVNALWLRDGHGPQWRRVPLVGYLEKSERLSAAAPDTGDSGTATPTMAFDLEAADPIAVEVRGASMMPAYRPGDILICTRLGPGKSSLFENRDCVVQLTTGDRYAKRVAAGSEAGLYNLLSYAGPPLTDVRLDWAAPIVWIKRAGG